DDLLKMKRDQGVYLELVFRKGVRDEFRKEALTGLARLQNKSELRVLLDAIRSHDDQAREGREPAGQGGRVGFDLVPLLTERHCRELAGVRGELETLATKGSLAVTRELGYVALIAADGITDKAWQLGMQSPNRLEDLVRAMPLIRDPGQRASL